LSQLSRLGEHIGRAGIDHAQQHRRGRRTPLPRLGSNDVNHQTPHPDRWGGWYVTSEGAPPPYSQRAHGGNITFSPRGDTSNQVFTDWLTSSPETRGYPSANSDIVSLLVFDHQARAINLMSRLNWEARVAASEGREAAPDNVRRLATELADYLLFAGEAPAPVPLTPRPGFAARLERTPPRIVRAVRSAAAAHDSPVPLPVQLHGVLGSVRRTAGGREDRHLFTNDRHPVQ
jgi:hypothetical protein